MEQSAPSDLTPDERAALRALVQSAEHVKTVLSERDRLAPSKVRPVLRPFVRSWGALHAALQAKSSLPSTSDAGTRASAVSTTLFPNGLRFTQTDAGTAWAEGQRLIERIRDERLATEINDLVGREFLVAATDATDALAGVVGIAAASGRPSAKSVLVALASFRTTVRAYCRVLAANCDETDDASVERFLSAVAPVDRQRTHKRAGSRTTATPTQAPASTSNGREAAAISSVGTIKSPANGAASKDVAA